MNENDYQLSVRYIARVLFAFVTICGLMLPGNAQTKAGSATPVYRDASLPIEKRVDDLVSRMTLEEKVRANAAHCAGHPPARRSLL